MRQLVGIRYALLAALLLTYIWRFQDLAPFLVPLRLAAIATVGSWTYLVFRPRMTSLRQALRLPYVRFFLIWTLWLGVTVLFALNPTLAWETWFSSHLKTVTMFLFTLTCLTSIVAVRFVFAVHVLGSLVLCFFYVKSGFPLWGSPVPMYDVNDLALILNVAVPMTLFFAMTAPYRQLRVGAWTLLLVQGTCILMTQSRGGLLTLGAVLLFMMSKARTPKPWMRAAPPILLVLGFLALPAEVKDRLTTIFSPTEDYNYIDQEGRVQIWTRGLGYIRAHPVAGVGMANFRYAELTLSPQALEGGRGPRLRGGVAHNMFLQVGAESGVVGISLYMMLIVTAALRLGRLRKQLSKATGDRRASEIVIMADFTLLAIFGFCVGGFFLSQGYSPLLFSLIAIVGGLELSAKTLGRGHRASTHRAWRRT